MRKSILTGILSLLVFTALGAQKTPHPEYLMRYYFTAVEGAKQSLVPPISLLKSKQNKLNNYFACFQPEGLRFNQFPSQAQTGYDTIFAIEEMISCGPFLAHRTETTNGEYKDFLRDSQWIKENLGFTVSQLKPDTTVWAPFAANAERSAVTNPYTWLYFQANTYDQYPVVGVSQLQATAYCQWLTHELNTSPEYASLQAAMRKAGLTVIAELPTTAEWMLNIQIELSETLLKPLPARQIPAKPYPSVSHLVGNVAEWTSTPAYGHLFNNKTTILNTNGQLIENAYQQMTVFDFSGYLVDAETLKQHYAVKGGAWSQDFYYLDPMAVFFMQSNHRNNHVGFRTVLHFYPIRENSKD